MLTDDQKISVTYPDEKNAHETTVGEVKERFKQEHPGWLANFLNEMEKNGFAYTNFGGKYELVK